MLRQRLSTGQVLSEGGFLARLPDGSSIKSKIIPQSTEANESQADLLRTLARSRQLEAEEQSNARHATSRGEFSDDPDEQADMATMLRDDQIDFLDPENEYQDYDGSGFGTGDEEQAINLQKQRPL